MKNTTYVVTAALKRNKKTCYKLTVGDKVKITWLHNNSPKCIHKVIDITSDMEITLVTGRGFQYKITQEDFSDYIEDIEIVDSKSMDTVGTAEDIFETLKHMLSNCSV